MYTSLYKIIKPLRTAIYESSSSSESISLSSSNVYVKSPERKKKYYYYQNPTIKKSIIARNESGEHIIMEVDASDITFYKYK